MRPMDDLQILSEAPAICLMHLRKVLKHFILIGLTSHSIASHLTRSDGTAFWLQLELERQCWLTWYSGTHMWLVDAIRKTSNVLYLCKEGFEILHEQWLSLLVIQHIICHTERVSKLWLFFCNLRVNIDGNGHSVTHMWKTNAIGSTAICLVCV